MDRQQAMADIGFLKKLLDDTGMEIAKSGWAFIQLGIIFMFSTLSLFITSWIHIGILNSAAVILINLGVWGASFAVYRKNVVNHGTTTLEQQIWQVWLWAIFITVILKSLAMIWPITLTIEPGNSVRIIRFDETLILLSLIATGILANRSYFYKLGVVVFILNALNNWFNYHLLLTKNNFLTLIYVGLLILNSFLPFIGTGIYFLSQQAKLRAGAFGNPNGTQ